jgi:hypothetical protein
VGLAARHKRWSLRPAWALSFLFLFFKKKENSRKKKEYAGLTVRLLAWELQDYGHVYSN